MYKVNCNNNFESIITDRNYEINAIPGQICATMTYEL